MMKKRMMMTMNLIPVPHLHPEQPWRLPDRRDLLVQRPLNYPETECLKLTAWFLKKIP